MQKRRITWNERMLIRDRLKSAEPTPLDRLGMHAVESVMIGAVVAAVAVMAAVEIAG